jgi:hypothetical protein
VKLIVATPVHGVEFWTASVSAGYSESLRIMSEEFLKAGEPFEVVWQYSADVVRARNRLVAIILRDMPDATHVLWWDSDLWPEDRRIVKEMIATGEDLVSAPYTNKSHPMRWTHNHLSPRPPAKNNLQEIRDCSFGFTITSLQCLRKMSSAGRKYTDITKVRRGIKGDQAGIGRIEIADVFGLVYAERPIHGGNADVMLSEDYSFCHRWRELGGRVSMYLGAGYLCHAGSHGWTAREMERGTV